MKLIANGFFTPHDSTKLSDLYIILKENNNSYELIKALSKPHLADIRHYYSPNNNSTQTLNYK